MNDPDKQLVRTHGDGRVNLAVGEPFFLHPHLQTLVREYDPDAEAMPTYPQYAGQPELLAVLKKIYPDHHVVVANGAKQAILAGLYALRGDYGHVELVHRTPYWPTYPTMAALSAMSFSPHADLDLGHKPACLVMSSPNNPDSWTTTSDAFCHLWDAAYAHPVYGWGQFDGALAQPIFGWDPALVPGHEISVWSAAKLLGLSGLRVGWLLTRDEGLAKSAADYVEKTTSGVNVDAQLRVAGTLAYMLGHPLETARIYHAARVSLITNANAFLRALEPHCKTIEGLPVNHRGMFAWFYADDPERFAAALETSGVAVVEGRACGAQEPGWYRLSLGHRATVLAEGLRKITEALR